MLPAKVLYDGYFVFLLAGIVNLPSITFTRFSVTNTGRPTSNFTPVPRMHASVTQNSRHERITNVSTKRLLKLEIDGLIVKAEPSIKLKDEPTTATSGVCPSCNRIRATKNPIADLTQYGFTWDLHKTVFRCKCGCTFYHEYRIWHTDESETQHA